MTSTWRFALLSVLLTLAPQTVHARTDFLPAGTKLNVRTTQPIAASSARRGMRVDGYFYRPVFGPNARIVVPRGSPVTLEVEKVHRSLGRDVVTLSVRWVHVGRRRFRVFSNEIEVTAPKATQLQFRLELDARIPVVRHRIVGG